VRRLLIEREHRLDSLQLSAALFAGGQVLGNCRSLFGDSLTVSNQLFFLQVFHDSVPIARACVLVPTMGCSARLSFCTARKTVFFVAFELDFKTPRFLLSRSLPNDA